MFHWFTRLLDRFKESRLGGSGLSTIVGLSGLACFAVLSILSTRLGIALIEFVEFSLSGMESWLTPLVSLVFGYAPLGACLSMVVLVPMMCSFRLMVRFALAIGMVLPSLIAIGFIVISLLGDEGIEGWRTIAAIVLSFTLGVAAVAIAVQYLTRGSLSPIRPDGQVVARKSVGMLMELMFVSAIVCVMIRSLATETISMFTFLVLLVVGSVFSTLTAMITVGWLSTGRRIKVLLASSLGLIYLGCATILMLDPVLSVGNPDLLLMLTRALVHSFVFTLIFFGLIVVQLRWLRGCGWKLVRV